MTGHLRDGRLGPVEHPNAVAFRTLYEARRHGDVSGVVSQVAEEVQWWELGTKEAVIGRIALSEHLRDAVDPYVTSEIHDVLGNDEHVVGLIHATAMIDDVETDVSYAEVVHYDSAGRVIKRQVFPSDISKALHVIG